MFKITGVVSFIDDDPNAKVKLNSEGRFMEIPLKMAQRFLNNNNDRIKGKKKKIPILFNHFNNLPQLGTVDNLEIIERGVNDNDGLGNKKRKVLQMTATLSNRSFIKALQESSHFYNTTDKHMEYYSPDGFLSGGNSNPSGEMVTGRSAIMKRFPGLSIGHLDNDGYDIEEISLCYAGARPGTILTDASYSDHCGLAEDDTGSNSTAFLKAWAAKPFAMMTSRAGKIAEDINMLGVKNESLVYGLENKEDDVNDKPLPPQQPIDQPIDVEVMKSSLPENNKEDISTTKDTTPNEVEEHNINTIENEISSPFTQKSPDELDTETMSRIQDEVKALAAESASLRDDIKKYIAEALVQKDSGSSSVRRDRSPVDRRDRDRTPPRRERRRRDYDDYDSEDDYEDRRPTKKSFRRSRDEGEFLHSRKNKREHSRNRFDEFEDSRFDEEDRDMYRRRPTPQQSFYEAQSLPRRLLKRQVIQDDFDEEDYYQVRKPAKRQRVIFEDDLDEFYQPPVQQRRLAPRAPVYQEPQYGDYVVVPRQKQQQHVLPAASQRRVVRPQQLRPQFHDQDVEYVTIDPQTGMEVEYEPVAPAPKKRVVRVAQPVQRQVVKQTQPRAPEPVEMEEGEIEEEEEVVEEQLAPVKKMPIPKAVPVKRAEAVDAQPTPPQAAAPTQEYSFKKPTGKTTEAHFDELMDQMF